MSENPTTPRPDEDKEAAWDPWDDTPHHTQDDEPLPAPLPRRAVVAPPTTYQPPEAPIAWEQKIPTPPVPDTRQQVQNYQFAPRARKEVGTAYILWLFLGIVGGHQFYLGNTGRGILYAFTLGCLGFGPLIDLFTMKSQVETANTLIAAGAR